MRELAVEKIHKRRAQLSSVDIKHSFKGKQEAEATGVL
ncbi:uncharacterized, partial [Tachysurus ichikawai]